MSRKSKQKSRKSKQNFFLFFFWRIPEIQIKKFYSFFVRISGFFVWVSGFFAWISGFYFKNSNLIFCLDFRVFVWISQIFKILGRQSKQKLFFVWISGIFILISNLPMFEAFLLDMIAIFLKNTLHILDRQKYFRQTYITYMKILRIFTSRIRMH
jgi:hypothetical protein